LERAEGLMKALASVFEFMLLKCCFQKVGMPERVKKSRYGKVREIFHNEIMELSIYPSIYLSLEASIIL